MNAINEESWTNMKAVARYVGVTTRTIQLKMKEGLPYVRLGHRCVRFKLAEVDAWLKARCV